jgi:hypothetical protein
MTGPTPRPQCAEILISQCLRARTVPDAGHGGTGHHHLPHSAPAAVILLDDMIALSLLNTPRR